MNDGDMIQAAIRMGEGKRLMYRNVRGQPFDKKTDGQPVQEAGEDQDRPTG